MFAITKKLRSTCTSHYLGKGYPKACKNVHGHNFFYEITVKGDNLNQFDMLVDFGDIKSHCDKWLQENWDHVHIFSTFQHEERDFFDKMGWRWVEFPVDNANVTSENMAKFLAKKFYEELKALYPNITTVGVAVWETEDSKAYYEV